jgi:hypothetical protein
MALTSRQQALNDEIARLSQQCMLDGWASFVETVHVPTDIAAALATGRPELLALMQPRALDAAECGKLYQLLRVLITTNMGLQQHAQQLAQLVDNWMQQFAGSAWCSEPDRVLRQFPTTVH